MSTYLDTVYNAAQKGSGDYPAQLINYLCRRFDILPGMKLLELGCGRGNFINAFSRKGIECFAVDVDPMAGKSLQNVVFEVCNLEKDKLPFQNDSFDFIYHKSVIEHFYEPNHLLNETMRVLKKGGVTIILTPDWASQHRTFYEDITHRRPYDRLALHDALKMLEFENVTSEIFTQLPLTWRCSAIKTISNLIALFLDSYRARQIAGFTGIKSIRWAAEKMILGVGKKAK